ncbi:MAG: biotin/lipoyl-binding protein [candidate division Zixibacteria bacterium]|nr:biotin/lipoyl-binding protein [candidate division Zixibacteria bacterium]
MPKYTATIGETQIEVELLNGNTEAKVNGEAIHIDPAWVTEDELSLNLLLGGQSYDLRIEEDEEHLHIAYAGNRYECDVIDTRLADLKKRAGDIGGVGGKTVVKSPMPGLVVKVTAEEGQALKKGDRILILEAMKMENDVKAPREGTLTKLSVAPGDTVEGGRELAVSE